MKAKMKMMMMVAGIAALAGTNAMALTGTCGVELAEWDKVFVIHMNCDTGDYVATCDVFVGDEVFTVNPALDNYVNSYDGYETGLVTKYFMDVGDYYDYIDSRN